MVAAWLLGRWYFNANAMTRSARLATTGTSPG
jgi:hypothetical protein